VLRLVPCSLFVTVFLVEGARRADYSPLRHPVSALSLGPGGWAQVANFSAAGALYVAGATGLFRVPDDAIGTRWGSTLVGAAGLGLLGSAVFATDPVSGYPPGDPDTPAEVAPGEHGPGEHAPGEQSVAMTRHGMAAIPIVLGLPTAALAYARRFRRAGEPQWALYSAGTAASMVVNFVLAAAGFGQRPGLVNLAGLFQRASIICAFTWVTAVSARALNRCAPA
jgi:Protein of unknown function (DUF998)